jgi:hypothetical protein
MDLLLGLISYLCWHVPVYILHTHTEAMWNLC